MNLLTMLFGMGLTELDAAAVHARLGQKLKPVLLDVREPHEYAGGHIPGARLLPLGALAGRMKELPREREIICVCRSGSRSRNAASQLTAAGYKAANLRGGMIAWGRGGLPIKKSKT